MAYRHSPIAAYSGDDLESRSGDDRPESVDLGDKPIYLLEHLATFTVAKESGIMYPADGMRKLLQLEKTTGIWSQKMQLCLDRNWVLIVDYETRSIIEKFPATSIQEPTAFTSNDPMEMYNNILVFIVGSGAPNTRSEMHIFQCQSISAIHLVEDLKQLRDGKLIHHRDVMPHYEPKRPVAVTSNRPNRAEYIRDRDRERDRDVRDYHNNSHDTDSEIGGINDETSSTSSEKYERDVTVLNHCFDDIEKFIARLQHAAAAARELERRRKNRKSKKKDPGEGLLTLRTRPPHEKEFVDIFSKFKLSFNLLAKLKAHIHDPNAPELVHFLFTPLALIVDASHDSCYDPNLPARVIKPLLTREAINLLINCVTSKETELWRSLGDAWTIPRDQWKDSMISAYHPVFYDGWSPDFPVIDEVDGGGGGAGGGAGTSTSTNSKKKLDLLPPAHSSNDYNAEYDYGPPPPPPQASSPGLRDYSNRSEISVDSIERNGAALVGNGREARYQHHEPTPAESFLEDLQARGAKVVQVTYPRTANNDKELTVVRGEYLEVLDDTRKWWKARNSRGQVAHVPHTIVQVINYENGDAPYRNHKSDVLQDRYLQSNSNNDQGASADWVRNKHVVTHHKTSVSEFSSIDAAVVNGSDLKLTSTSTKPPPPPPMPSSSFSSVPTTPITLKSESSTRSHKTSRSSVPPTPDVDDMQRELREVLTLFKEKKRNIEFTKTPEVYIQQSSNPDEVQDWLKQKGFSENVQSRLKDLSGAQLFALKKDTLEEYCGSEEGKRLASQLNLQKNVSGYKTARSSELMSILAKVRRKTDQQDDDSGNEQHNSSEQFKNEVYGIDSNYDNEVF